MKRTGLLAIMLFWGCIIIGQNIQVTFIGSGEATNVDSITATNLNTNQSITFPGDEILILEQSSGIMSFEESPFQLKLFPNPFDNSSTLTFTQSKSGKVQISASNLMGQVVFQSDQYLEVGQYSFQLSFNTPGIFLISIIGDNERGSIRAICSESTSTSVDIVSSSNTMPDMEYKSSMVSKNQQTTYSLAYSPDEVLHFECQSGKHTTIFTDSPVESQNYEIEFVDCTDPDGRTYNIVKIGDQFWMEENLAYLNSVSDPNLNLYDNPYQYVYGYEGSGVEEAKETENYRNYGVLYNLKAALSSCPDGWRLPYDDEWVQLELYLGMDTCEVFRYGFRGTGIGSKLKTKYFSQSYEHYWLIHSNNFSGFNAPPGGYWYGDSGFLGQGERAIFWFLPAENYREGRTRLPVRAFRDFSRTIERLFYFSGGGLSVRCIRNHPPEPAEVSTILISEVTGTTSIGGGEIFSRGGTNLLEKGICWSTEENPTVQDNTSVSNETDITYTCQLSELLPRTTYFVRAYVRNELGISYGQQESFTTVDGGFTEFLDNSSISAAKASENRKKYGVLYNYTAALTACPAGWHLPTDEDWMKLEKALGMSDSETDQSGWRQSGSVGKKLKAKNLWIDEGNGINSALFRAVPAGTRTTGGNLSPTGVSCGFWSSNENDSQENWHRRIYYSTDGIKRDRGSRSEGFSVRCTKNE